MTTALFIAVAGAVPVTAQAVTIPTFVAGDRPQLILHDSTCDFAPECADVSLSCPSPGDYSISVNSVPLEAMKAWMTDGLELTVSGLNVPRAGLSFDRIRRSAFDDLWSVDFGFSLDADSLIDPYASEIAIHAPHAETSAAVTPQSEGEIRKLEAICSNGPESGG